MDEDRELEGWKDISAALGVSEAAAKRYAREGTATRVPLPHVRNFRGRVAVRASVVRSWKEGGAYARLPKHQPRTMPKTLVDGSPNPLFRAEETLG